MKKLFAMLLGLMIGHPVVCVAGVYSPSVDSHALVWNEYPSPGRSIEWKGRKDDDGYAEGVGVVLFENGKELSAAYMGVMSRGKMDGFAIAIYPKTGSSYHGYIRNWTEEGQGTMRFPDGGWYVGGWKSGKREGEGSQWAGGGGLVFKGRFSDDRPVGGGVLRRSGGVFSAGPGLVKKYPSSKLAWFGNRDAGGLAEGFGVVVSRRPDGRVAGVYYGRAVEGVVSDDVLAIYAVARQAYIGSIKNWCEDGQGTMFYPDGNSYEGEWSNEKRNGRGLTRNSSRQVVEDGVFSDDRFVGPVERKAFPVDLASREETVRPLPAESQLPPEQPVVGISNTPEADEACANIVNLLLFYKIGDWITNSEEDPVGVFLMHSAKTFHRNGEVDRNLAIIYPDLPRPAIHLMRHMLCSFADGNLSWENIQQRMLKSEATDFAYQQGEAEGDMVKAAIYLNDLSKKLEKAKEKRVRNGE